jgi:hypothetical protein
LQAKKDDDAGLNIIFVNFFLFTHKTFTRKIEKKKIFLETACSGPADANNAAAHVPLPGRRLDEMGLF